VAEDRDQWWVLVNMTTNLEVQEGLRVLAYQEELRSMRLLFEYILLAVKKISCTKLVL
jgi:hypothetical protein